MIPKVAGHLFYVEIRHSLKGATDPDKLSMNDGKPATQTKLIEIQMSLFNQL